ncbi:hypothetical protein [Mangrovibacterium marinum]|uniref:Uncharacterized protein n=1 Tax=Mangrovibacterium marinum TaxID=1639118 RepID=A0A2T5BSQ3_9BACT|nr:hypothetical protein [Mangrovibacterium marinum]PTN02417.1 hypothetical protein C8N47_1391 [Mangrovibacterium marinum]
MASEDRILNQLRTWTSQGNSPKQTDDQSLREFTASVTDTLSNLQQKLDSGAIQAFYEQIESLKYLIEYSDELNKNWYLIRAYSGALKRLMQEKTVEHAAKVYAYYEQTYGGRRVLRSENWFEQQRWEFIDELKTIGSQEALNKFLEKRTKKLNGYFQGYKSELLLFIQDLQKLG